jgi:hypothetical protein
MENPGFSLKIKKQRGSGGWRHEGGAAGSCSAVCVCVCVCVCGWGCVCGGSWLLAPREQTGSVYAAHTRDEEGASAVVHYTAAVGRGRGGRGYAPPRAK